MSQAQAAVGVDRLPWLEDEPALPRKPDSRRTMGAGAVLLATLFVAGASYWMGANSGDQRDQPKTAVPPATTVHLPQAREAEPAQPQVVMNPQPEVQPVVEREVPIARPAAPAERVDRPSSARRDARLVREAPKPPPRPAIPVPAPRVAKPAPVTANRPLSAWPAWQSQGAAGRIVRIGAFGTRQQAKLGWRYMVRSYPAVAHLQATVVETRNSRGRRFYRFQIGTTSQAHSEVLCQRMERIRLSCAVVGLPWKPKGVER